MRRCVMKRTLFLLLNILHILLCTAQSFCYNDGYEYENLLANGRTSFVNYSGPYHVRVYFHIIRMTNGSGEYAFQETDISSCLEILNDDYAPHNIFFDYAGMDYIDNTIFYGMDEMQDSYFDALINTNIHEDAIDIYLLPTSGSIGGRASSIPGRALAVGGTMDGVSMGISHILSHEMGHCLGLFHTFHGGEREPSGCAELVDGTNCTDCGDFLCDTPADPFPLFGYVNSMCEWENNMVRDRNGDLYTPDTHQIMAYVSPLCMEHFSNGQGERMRAHITTQQILQNRLTPSVVYLQNQLFDGGGIEVITAYDSVVAGFNVTSGNMGNVIIQPNTDITFKAGKKIVLNGGVFICQGARFKAEVETMSPNYSRTKKDSITNDYMPLLNNTQWISMSYGFEPPVVATILKQIGDTLIDGKIYSIIKTSYVNVDNAINMHSNGKHRYLYEDVLMKQIYEYDQYTKKNILLYDFSLEVGDTMFSNTKYRLSDISYVNNSGYTRKQYTFTHTSLSDSIIWIEGIGNNIDLFNPTAINCPEISRIVCVQNIYETVYNTGDFRGYTCDDIDAIPELQEIDTIGLSSLVTKVLRNGQVLILRNGKTYTMQGQEVK